MIYVYVYTHVIIYVSIYIYTCHNICHNTYMHLPGATLLNTTPEVVKPLAAIALELSKLSSYTGRDLAAHRSVKGPVKTPERS